MEKTAGAAKILVEPPGLWTARGLAAAGHYGRAREAYVAVLTAQADCLEALVELGSLALADGYGQAAWAAFSRAVLIDPAHPVGLCGLGNLLAEQEDYAKAKSRYLAALETAPDYAPAHQGLARCLAALGEPEAAWHFHAGFAGNAVVPPRACARPRVPLLLLAAAAGGNVPCKGWIDPEIFAVTTIYADFFDARAKLPAHEIVVNAIGDADLCGAALVQAGRMVANAVAPLINPPDLVARTSRAENAQRLRTITGVVTPRIQVLTRAELLAHRLRFPVLLRSPGFHTGRNFLRVETAAGLEEAATLPGEALLAIEWIDVRGQDGMARKYRVMFIDGGIYPLHLAASHDWKVHYVTSAMAEHEYLRAEEQRFLEDMPCMLGGKAMAALHGVRDALGLDYAGVDFALAADGALILFEANATMVMYGPDDRAIWDYRRPAIAAAQHAASRMVKRRIARIR